MKVKGSEDSDRIAAKQVVPTDSSLRIDIGKGGE
jgi:hypothetical protein